MNTTNKARGKSHEKKVAEKFNGVNIGILNGEDVATDKFSIECKSRVKFVGFTWYEQALRNNKRGKIPIVVVHLKNKSYDNDLVMVNIKDFLELINEKAD